MILTEREIATRIENGELIDNNPGEYKPENLHCISYDIAIGGIVSDEKDANGTYKDVKSYYLQPGETIFVKSDIKLKLPMDCIGIVYERNSVMRQGLEVDGPVYQPGHETYAFLRVRNIFAREKKLSLGDPIAQIRFEKLESVPLKTYGQDEDLYQYEDAFRGVQGEMKHSWESETIRYEKKIEELNEKEMRIYANVLTFMGIFVSIFSLLTFSFSSNMLDVNPKNIVLIDLSVGLILYLLMGVILILVNHIKRSRFLCLYWLVALALIGVNFWMFQI